MAAEDVPAQLRLVESFANSVDLEAHRDDLDSPERLGRWLADQGFPGITPTPDELALAVGLRAALRAELMAHHGVDEDTQARAELDRYAAQIPMRAAFGEVPATFVPVGAGVASMLGQVLAAMVIAERENTWHRLKICREDTCQAAFFDRSKNQSKTWCSMRVCGNRSKTRSYRSRKAPGSPRRPEDQAPVAAQ